MCAWLQGRVFKGWQRHPASFACAALQAAAFIAFLARFLVPGPGRGDFCLSVAAARGGVLAASASRGSGLSVDRTMAPLAALLAITK